jgi:PAS domain S-box-containing protein
MDTIELLKKENAALMRENEDLKVRESERFRKIFEYSRLANKIISPDLKILHVNMALVKLLGYENREEIIGTRILDYSPLDDHPHWRSLQKQLWEKEISFFNLETRLIKKDGTMIWSQVTSILFPEGSQSLGYSIIEDVSDQRLLKQHKEEFISVASHELKTPITSLKANLQLMSRMLKTETTVTERLKQMTENAEKHVIKLGFLVTDLLSSTKIEQGQLSLKKKNFVLKELVEECCSHIRLEGKYHINFMSSTSFTIFADRDKIDQVLVNLVNNAVKYASESLEISIDAQHIKGTTKVSVSDKGKGIEPENLGNLFDRYFRLAKDNNRASGLGLGLYISAEIIRLHGGEMGVESKLGEGTTFWFTIPDEQAAVGSINSESSLSII